jgi:hypothetical protein
MDRQILAICVQEAGKLISGLLSIRTPKIKQKDYPPIATESAPPGEYENISNSENKIQKGTACLPCTNSHLHTCRGLLAEAVRMSHDGLNPEAMDRVDKCLSEIAAAERIDLSPENIISLPPDEKIIADYASKIIREIRHGLEGLSSPQELEHLASKTANLQKHVGTEWFKLRLNKMSEGEKKDLARKATEKVMGELKF